MVMGVVLAAIEAERRCLRYSPSLLETGAGIFVEMNIMEMNMHMPQNPLAETELRLLAATWTQIVSPSSNNPIISIYQDSLLGSNQFTRDNVRFSPRAAMNLLGQFGIVLGRRFVITCQRQPN